MKKKLQKLLLLAAAMLVGGNAWGATENASLLPTGGVTTVSTSSSTVVYSESATSWTINQGGITGGSIGSYAGPYCLVKFDASNISGDILSAFLRFDYAPKAYNTSYNISLLGAADWDATTVVWSTLSSSAKSATQICSGTWSTKNVSGTIEYDVTNKVSKSLMGMAIYCNTAREQLISNIRLDITYATGTVYTATFTETNGLNPTVDIYSDAAMTTPVINGSLTDGTTYYYKALLNGYEDYTSFFTVNGENPSINYTMTIKPHYIIKAMCDGVFLEEISSGYASVSTTYSTYVSKYIKNNDIYYVLDDDSNTALQGFYASYTMGSGGNEEKEINYTPSTNVVFFSEWEKSTQSISNSGYYSSYNNSSMSGGWAKAVQGNANRDLHQEFTVTADAIYRLEMPYYNSNDKTRQYVLYLDGTGDDNKLETKSISGSTGGIFSQEVKLTSGIHTIYLKEVSGATLTPQFDYLKISLAATPITVYKAVGGMTTFASDDALDFTDSDLKAYIATGTTTKDNATVVSLTKVERIPANTPMLVWYDGTFEEATKTVYVPVISASEAETVVDNLFKAGEGSSVETNPVAGTTNYVLTIGENDGEYGFYLANGRTVAVGKAYLQIVGASGKIRLNFGDENDTATAISTITEGNTKFDGATYNLAGQRVDANYKGIVIRNGKKFLVK